VHAHNAVPAGDAALRWLARERTGRGLDLPLVVSIHGGDLDTARRSRRGRLTVTATLRAAAAVLANSELTRQGVGELIGQNGGLQVVHPGADPPPAVPAHHSEPTLVTVAHLEPHKGQADVIRVLAALRERHPRLRYVLVGRGPDRASLKALARSLGIADRVTFLGALPHGAALTELARCHVHVMASRREPFGVAHIEAMVAGLPAIAGAGTGAEELARAGEGMMLVPAGDVQALTRAIDELIGDPDRRRLARVTERRVAEIVAEPDRLDEILVQPQRPRHTASSVARSDEEADYGPNRTIVHCRNSAGADKPFQLLTRAKATPSDDLIV
jgi:glycosyltransferase involved in cell wall biosynthesis